MNNLSSLKIKTILKKLNLLYPQASCTLLYNNPLELLIAAVLSSQSTDKKVNEIIPLLFKHFSSIQKLAQAKEDELKDILRPIGLHNVKSRYIINITQIILFKYKGEIPNKRRDLIKLPGVGRKIANLVLSEIFKIPTITVDTHVKRICKRLNLTNNQNPIKIEIQLMKIIPQSQWNKFCHQIISHGRRICRARNPLCNTCIFSEYCTKKTIK